MTEMTAVPTTAPAGAMRKADDARVLWTLTVPKAHDLYDHVLRNPFYLSLWAGLKNLKKGHQIELESEAGLFWALVRVNAVETEINATDLVLLYLTDLTEAERFRYDWATATISEESGVHGPFCVRVNNQIIKSYESRALCQAYIDGKKKIAEVKS